MKVHVIVVVAAEPSNYRDDETHILILYSGHARTHARTHAPTNDEDGHELRERERGLRLRPPPHARRHGPIRVLLTAALRPTDQSQTTELATTFLKRYVLLYKALYACGGWC